MDAILSSPTLTDTTRSPPTRDSTAVPWPQLARLGSCAPVLSLLISLALEFTPATAVRVLRRQATSPDGCAPMLSARLGNRAPHALSGSLSTQPSPPPRLQRRTRPRPPQPPTLGAKPTPSLAGPMGARGSGRSCFFPASARSMRLSQHDFRSFVCRSASAKTRLAAKAVKQLPELA